MKYLIILFLMSLVACDSMNINSVNMNSVDSRCYTADAYFDCVHRKFMRLTADEMGSRTGKKIGNECLIEVGRGEDVGNVLTLDQSATVSDIAHICKNSVMNSINYQDAKTRLLSCMKREFKIKLECSI